MLSCKIEKHGIWLNEELIFQESDQSASFAVFAKNAFKALQIDYPKFFKMDALSKLAFLGAEILLKQLDPTSKQHTALVFANRSSSLDTDLKHQESIADKEAFYPSPAVFVYTLPNICLGEISIRHQLHTEQCFFVFDSYEQAAPFLQQYAQQLLAQGIAPQVLTAWAEVLQDDYLFIGKLRN